MKQVYIIHNLDCANCAAKMEAQIRAIPEVRSASIIFATRQLRLEAANPEALLPRIQSIVRSIEPDARVAEHHHHEHKHNDGPAILIGAALFAAGLLLPFPFSIGVFLLAYLVLGFQVLKTALLNLFKGQLLDENFLMSIATIGAFCIGEFPEAVGVMLFYRVGEWFEHRAVERSRSQIMSAIDFRPETVLLADGRTIPAQDASIGDLLLIRPGDRIGLDGTVISGESRIDTSPITGEPVPKRVTAGSAVTSGCINGEGQLTVRVNKPLSESMVTRILEVVEEAAAGKPKMDRFITRFSRIYTPVVVLAAVATAVIPSLFTGNWSYWIYTALSFLVMSCPCALVLSVPLTFFSGIGVGSRKGILFKGGASIETMAQIKALVLDKTGTITKGDFSVQKVVGSENLLAMCAACEQNSTHPVAKSIVNAARDLPLQTPDTLEEIAGHGIRATMNGDEILCGNEKLMKKYDLSGYRPEGAGTVVIVAKRRNYLGYILIADTLKEDATNAIRRVQSMGIHTAMLTGDGAESAQAVAEQAGIQEVHAQLLPRQKLEWLQQIRQKKGAVMFVGDGINDAPVLSGADVGAAMGSGADAAIEAADVVFLTGQVSAIPESIAIARQTRSIAIQNVVFALSIKALVMTLGLLGHASMWAAVFADSGVAMLCVLNSIRMLYRRHSS